MNDLT
jgi:hypothetical protein